MDDFKRFVFGFVSLWCLVVVVVYMLVDKDIIPIKRMQDENVYYYSSIKSQLNGEHIIGSYIEYYNHSTKELTVKLANGESKLYRVDNMPAVVENEKILSEEMLSKFYTYLFQKQYYRRIKIVDWKVEDNSLVFESGDKVVTLRYGVGSFYEVGYLK